MKADIAKEHPPELPLQKGAHTTGLVKDDTASEAHLGLEEGYRSGATTGPTVAHNPQPRPVPWVPLSFEMLSIIT